MKNLPTFILSAVVALFVALPLHSNNADDGNKSTSTPIYVPVTVGPLAGDPVKHQRTSLTPFDFHYQSGIITAEFYDNIGLVSVSVINADTGEMWYADMDSSAGMQTLDISTYNWSGFYELSIADGSGRTYFGFFEL